MQVICAVTSEAGFIMGYKPMGKAAGLETAITLVGQASAEQLELLSNGGVYRHGAALTKNPLGGRPNGSIAKSTAEWARFILARYTSPLVFLAETYTRPTFELAKELECDTLDAFEVQRKCAESLARYVHSAMPQAVQVTSAERGVLLIGSLDVDQHASVLTLPVADYEENQRVSDGDSDKSDAQQSESQ